MSLYTKFPVIEHINQLDHLRDVPEFIFKQEGDLTIVFYAVAFPTTFSDDLRKECRGIVFDKDGRVHSRPFQKFFNLNENEETQESNINFMREYTIFEKLDGSMVRPVLCDGELRLFTKAGLSDVALEAEELAFTDSIKELCLHVMRSGHTPIFEYVGSPKYPIVLRYEEPELVLTAIRDNLSGKYEDQKTVEGVVNLFNVRCANHYPEYSLPLIKDMAKEVEDEEGWVLRFKGGDRMLKVKGEWYFNRHSVKERILVPRKLVKLILEGDIDDILPSLAKEEQRYVNIFSDHLSRGVSELTHKLQCYVDSITSGDISKKEFAQIVLSGEYKQHSNILFNVFEGGDLTKLLISDIIKSCSKDKMFEGHKHLVENNIE